MSAIASGVTSNQIVRRERRPHVGQTVFDRVFFPQWGQVTGAPSFYKVRCYDYSFNWKEVNKYFRRVLRLTVHGKIVKSAGGDSVKFIILFGPQAVGKMTVGQALADQTGLKLFHNHMTIDLVGPFFNYGTAEGKRLVQLFRQELFESVAKSDLPGMIFTFVWAFDMQEDWDYVKNVTGLFESHGADIYYVELEADMEERLARNTTENRLTHKPSKRDIAWSEAELKQTATMYRLNSRPGELDVEHYLRIDNTNLSPEETAAQIQRAFDL